MLSLLAALLLLGPPAARAEDPPPAAAEDPRDVDHDGTVSGKERRRARRADRRARRGEKTATGEVAVDEEQDAADAEASAERGQAASRSAAGAAAAMKGMLPSGDAGAMPGGAGQPAAASSTPGTKAAGAEFHAGGAAGKTGAGSFKPSSHNAGASGDPGKPSAPSDYLLAARSGYAPAFSAAGLKLSADGRSIVRADGSAASADDYARLRREIGSMPGALGRRPDFFSAISPERYADLKRGYKDRKEDDPVFKDVGTTENDRDFVHTKSCDKLSSGCNDNVEKPYKKGDYVAPEDLDSMWSALQKELDGSAAQGDGNMSLSASRSALAREKAVEAAEALSDDPGSPAAKKREEERKSAAAEAHATPVAQAVTAAQGIFNGLRALALPGRDPQTGEGANPLPLIAGAAVAVFAVGALILRRKD